MAPLLPFGEELGPGRLGLADEEDVGEVLERFRLDGRHGTADDGEAAPCAGFLQHFADAATLHAHAGDADDVGPRHALEVDRLDVLIDDRHAVMIGNQRGKQRKTGDRQVRPLAEQPHALFHPPEGDVETGIDDDDVAHWSLSW